MPKADKAHVIHTLEQVAILLELKGENVFKVKAFNHAARVLEADPRDLAELIETGELEKLKGIGAGHIAAMIRELYETGRARYEEELREQFPESLFELFRIPGLGAKRIRSLFEKLNIKSIRELETACRENRLAGLEGFGAKIQENILRGIEQIKKSAGYFLIRDAQAEAEKLLAFLKSQPGVLKAELAGSLRRRKELIRDIDILISAKRPESIHQAFCQYPEAESVITHGETKSSVTLKSGMNCDLRTVSREEFPYAWHHFTGSKEHNVAVRTLAKKKKIKVNEYGLFKGSRLLKCSSERDVFKALGMHYLPPEVRENTGEIEWALKKKFPKLVEEKDIRGILHVHSGDSDGSVPLREMVSAAEKMGFEYIGMADHSQSAFYANGLDAKRIEAQWKEIDRLQKISRIHILKGIELEILPDGTLDYPDSLLAQFDFTIGAVHARLNLPEKEMTDRICRAMENKYVTFLAHPTGRLLLEREPYAVDMRKVLEAAQKTGVALELNANPHRLDLDWRMCQAAKHKQIPIGIHPDAHSLRGLGDIVYGVGIARKGWLEARDIVNTKSLGELRKFLRRRK